MKHSLPIFIFAQRLARSAVIGATIAYWLFPSAAFSQPSDALAPHFSGKTVTIIVGSGPGGGYDIFGRLVARFGAKYLPGNPRFVVQNLAGAGGLRGFRAAMKAKPDGLTIGQVRPRFVTRTLFGVDVPDFDLKTLKILGTPSFAPREGLFCTRRTVATSWEGVLKLGRPVSIGRSAPGGLGTTLGPEFVEAMGGPIKIIDGYDGAAESMAAIDRGELEGTQHCLEGMVTRLYPQWIERKFVAPIFWWDSKPSQDYIRRLGASMPPHIAEAVGATAEQKKALEVAMGFGHMGRLFVVPPRVDEPIYQAWRSAFEAMVRDAEFRKAAEVAGEIVGLGTAEDFWNNIKAFEKLSPDAKELVKKMAGIHLLK
jgi:tripartite-type tricarboxylate transporter receptor subunit TctC